MSLIVQLCGFLVCAFIGLLGLTIIALIWQGKIDLSGLVSEANGSASTSRFQFLIVTFVIAISLFGMVQVRLNSTGFPDIPRGALILLGISAATFIVGKGISYSQSGVMATGDVKGTSSAQPRELVPLYLFLALAGLLGFAAYHGELSALKAALLALSGGLTIWFVTKFLRAVDTDGPPQLDTNWGGLGGGLGGWRCSSSLVYLICSFVLGAVLIVAFLNQSLPSSGLGGTGNAVTTSPAGTSEKKAEGAPPASAPQKSLDAGQETKPQPAPQPPK